MILGHAHPAIVSAVQQAATGGTSYGAPTPREMKLAEAISERVRSCEQVRFMNSGTEATSTAVRLARGYTGRDRVVIFHGNFHGATDALLAAGGSGVATLGLPGTAGVPAGAVAETMVVPYNEVPELDDTVACVIVEPVAANMGVVAPVPGFLAGLRAECDRVGALLVFDEVITGFRLGHGGAQAKYDVTPDLTTFGKVIGGGLPIGAVGGRREIMETLSPLGPVFHAGTLSGNPIATAAGLAALNELTDDVYIELMARARHLASMLPRRVRVGRIRRAVPGGRHIGRHVLRCGRPAHQLRDARSGPTRPRTAGSSTPCSTPASRWRRAPTRRSSWAWPTPTTCSPDRRAGPPRRHRGRRDARRRRPLTVVGAGASVGAGGTSSVAPMRQVISWRFVAAIGALLGLALFVNVAFADRGSIAEVVEPSAPPAPGAPISLPSCSRRTTRGSRCRRPVTPRVI